MKINVDIRQTRLKDGYTNIFGNDALNAQGVFDAECYEVMLERQLELLPFGQYQNFIKLWASKLRKGGKLVVISANSKKVIKDYLNGQISEEEFNERLFSGNLSLPTLSVVEDIMVQLGLTLERKSIDNEVFVVIGKRA